jgi:dolichyl-phosphate beta-glucosyltransferase
MVRKKKRQVKVPAVKNTSLRQVIPIYNMEKMDISIVIPAYNEESRIIPTLEKVYRYFKNRQIDFEIIVVDDGSKDNTVQAVKQWQMAHSFSSPSFLLPSPLRGEGQGEGENERIRIISHPTNKGKGAAVRTGVLAARGNLILFTDADLSTPIEEFTKLKKTIDEGYDIAIGSRGLSDSKIVVSQPWYRRYIGKIFPYLVRLIVMKDFKDTQCGFKLFRKEAGKNLFGSLKTEGFAFDVEILYRAVKGMYKIREIPVFWYNSKDSKLSLFRSPLQMFLSLLSIKKIV